ncbi:MAG: integrase [Alphaproteobacteria bacterium]|nr:MAG: integrase [Alphaproteobacteria bacterium]
MIKRYSTEIRTLVLARVDGGESMVAVAKDLGIPHYNVSYWVRMKKRGPLPPPPMLPGQKYSKELRNQALEMWKVEKKPALVARALGLKRHTVAYWIREYSGSSVAEGEVRRYSTEQKSFAVETARLQGVEAAAKALGAHESSVRSWLNSAGIEPKDFKRSRAIPVSHDLELSWITYDLPELEEWRVLSAQWIREQRSGMRNRLLALRYLFKNYFIDVLQAGGFATSPKDILSRASRLPSFFDNCLQKYARHVGRVRNNYAYDFLGWVLQTEFSIPDDFGRPAIPIEFHNPILRMARGGGGNLAESVRSPLPYGYIDELREMLVPGGHFCDWEWAQRALGGEQLSVGAGNAPDWFPVEEGRLDRDDPDCVWRIRERSSSAPVLEMWSPVRWVALFIKLCLPLRTIQVRLLDSGEADTWRYDHASPAGKWSVNQSHLKEGTERKPLRQGVFRRVIHQNSIESPSVILYINTNKTADALLSGSDKGYEIPWLVDAPVHRNAFYWLDKLRNWQEKYNPISSRTSWKQLDPRRLDTKSELQLAGFPDACFLFRTIEDGPDKSHLPLRGLDTVWHALLRDFQHKLHARGETHADGSPILLVDAARFKGVNFPLHSLRVSLITALALDGKVPFPILQKLAGHSRLVMTLYYTKLGTAYPAKELEEATARLDEKKSETIIRFLRDTEYKKLVKNAISNSSSTLALTIPEHPSARNPAGWMPMHHGLCMVGGNTSQLENSNAIGGCYNGGPNIGSASTPRYAPTPGGARNCVRCRWFVTAPHYLWALQAHVNTLFYHSDEAMNLSVKVEQELGSLRAAKAQAENARIVFPQLSTLRQAERLFETHMQRYSDLTEDVAATVKLMQRCVENAEQQKNAEQNALIAVGSEFDVNFAIEQVDSELLQIAGVCTAAEMYPDINPGKAVFRRAQLLDAALTRCGKPPMFMTLSEDQQLLAGNAFLRHLATAAVPRDPGRGQREVISLMDAGENLSEKLNLDIDHLLHRSVEDSVNKSFLLGAPR